MVQGTPLQRFLAFVIDFIIIAIVVSIFAHILKSNIAIPVMSEEIINSMPENIREVYNNSNGDISLFLANVYGNQELQNSFYEWYTSDGANFFNTYYQASFGLIAGQFAFYILVDFIYRVVIAFFWKGQTLGRFLTKTKIVTGDNKKPSFGCLFLREIIGFDLMGVFNCCCGIIFILNIVFVFTRNKTLGDMFAGTIYVRYDAKAEEIKNEFEHMKDVSDNIIDAENNPYAPPRDQVYTPDDTETQIVVDVDDKDE